MTDARLCAQDVNVKLTRLKAEIKALDVEVTLLFESITHAEGVARQPNAYEQEGAKRAATKHRMLTKLPEPGKTLQKALFRAF